MVQNLPLWETNLLGQLQIRNVSKFFFSCKTLKTINLREEHSFQIKNTSDFKITHLVSLQWHPCLPAFSVS